MVDMKLIASVIHLSLCRNNCEALIPGGEPKLSAIAATVSDNG